MKIEINIGDWIGRIVFTIAGFIFSINIYEALELIIDIEESSGILFVLGSTFISGTLIYTKLDDYITNHNLEKRQIMFIFIVGVSVVTLPFYMYLTGYYTAEEKYHKHPDIDEWERPELNFNTSGDCTSSCDLIINSEDMNDGDAIEIWKSGELVYYSEEFQSDSAILDVDKNDNIRIYTHADRSENLIYVLEIQQDGELWYWSVDPPEHEYTIVYE